jgi:hypothetical protein
MGLGIRVRSRNRTQAHPSENIKSKVMLWHFTPTRAKTNIFTMSESPRNVRSAVIRVSIRIAICTAILLLCTLYAINWVLSYWIVIPWVVPPSDMDKISTFEKIFMATVYAIAYTCAILLLPVALIPALGVLVVVAVAVTNECFKDSYMVIKNILTRNRLNTENSTIENVRPPTLDHHRMSDSDDASNEQEPNTGTSE